MPGVAQRVGRGIALLFHDHDTRRGWVVSSTPRPYFTSGEDPVPTLQEAGWAPGLVWAGGKCRSHRDSIPDRPARSQSLYRLSYRAQQDVIEQGILWRKQVMKLCRMLSNLNAKIYIIKKKIFGFLSQIKGGAKRNACFLYLPAISFFGVTSNKKSTFENLVQSTIWKFPFAKKLQLCHKKC